MQLQIGDLVQCRDAHYARGLGIVGRIGMVAELRKKDLRILFDADNQSIWLSKLAVNRILLAPTDSPTLLDRLSWVIRFVEATECELERSEAGDYVYTVVCPGLPLDKVLAVRDYMLPLLSELHLIPRGMSRLGLKLIFRMESPAAR